MPRANQHVVVDGSNLGTEGRDVPSLSQLNEAVDAFKREHPRAQMTVVVDATFMHKIARKEKAEFDKAIANHKIIMPPAGVVGRGDAFILQIAERANAVVLSNDSFQEFQKDNRWLFDEGRLIGGKPVQGIGWIFVDRVPVRASSPGTRRPSPAPAGRTTVKPAVKKAKPRAASKTPTVAKPNVRQSAAKQSGTRQAAARQNTQRQSTTKQNTTRQSATRAASTRSGSKPSTRQTSSSTQTNTRTSAQNSANKSGKIKAFKTARTKLNSTRSKPIKKVKALNSASDFMSFVTKYSIGDKVVGVVDSFSSHGCYLRSAFAQCYLPSAAMGKPAPSRARDVVSLGQQVLVAVESIDSDRRGINVTLVSKTVKENVDKSLVQTSSSSESNSKSSQKSTENRGADIDDDLLRSNKVPAKKSASKAKKRPTKKKAARATTSIRARRAAAKKATKKKATKKKATKKKATKKKATKKKATKKKATKKKATKKKATKKKATKKKATKKKATKKKATKKKATKKKATKKKATKKKAAKRRR